MVVALYAQAQPRRTPRAAGSTFCVGVGRVRVGARHRHGPSPTRQLSPAHIEHPWSHRVRARASKVALARRAVRSR